MLGYGILGNINAKGIEKDGFISILGKKNPSACGGTFLQEVLYF
jgi:hypothetical protein